MNYIVQANDNLLSIADKFGISVLDLIKENNLDYIYSLVPGLELVIPGVENNNDNQNNGVFSYYIVVKGDTLYQIGKRYGISPQILSEINGIGVDDSIYPDQQILVPREGMGLYITKDGDTMQYVLDSLNVSVEELLNDNQNIYLVKDQIISYKK